MSFFKDDPSLAGISLIPQRRYALPITGDSVLKAMANTYNAIGGLIDALATRTAIDPFAVLAVWLVESGGRAFTPGHPVLRFENHVFFKYWGAGNAATFDKHFQFGGRAGIPGKAHQNHKFRILETDPWLVSHNGLQTREYDAFRFGQTLGGVESACRSASFGGPQIMGFNHGACGYATAKDLFDAFSASERWHVLGFFDYCGSNSLIDEIQNHAWNSFGDKYNGDGAVYGPKIDAAFKKKSAMALLPKVPTPPVLALMEATYPYPLRTTLTKRPPVAA